MQNKGYVSIFRSLLDHPIWQEKPFSKGQAWVDILLMVSHTDIKIMFGNELVFLKRGSMITSERFLMDRWGWSKAKLRSFLKVLQDDQMIVKNSDRKKTTITVVKYGSYQNIKTTKRPQKDHKKTADRPLTDLKETRNNNDNNENNDNKRDKRACARAREAAPSLSDINTFIASEGLNVDGAKFHAHYERTDWKTTGGLSILSCWQDKLREWDRNERSAPTKHDRSQIATYDKALVEQMLNGGD